MQEHRTARRASIAAVTIAAATLTLVAMTAVNGATAEQTSWRPAITVNTLPDLPPAEPPDDPPDVPPEPTDPAPTTPPTTAVPDTSVTATTAVPTGTADEPPDTGPTTTASPTGDPTTTGPAGSTTSTTTTTLPQTSALTATPSEVDFGNVQIGASSSAAVLLTNSGTAPITGFQIRFSGPPSFGGGAFGCPSIQPNATCELRLFFFPATTDHVTGQAIVTVGDATVTVGLAGAGDEPTTTTSPPPQRFRIEPQDVSFGDVPLGSSATQTVTITNAIDQPQSSFVEFIRVPTGEGTTASWTHSETCTGATLQPGESCTLTVTFTPHTEGSVISVASVSVEGTYPVSVILRAVGGTLPATSTTTTVPAPPEDALTADVSAVDFGSVNVGIGGSSRVTLTNVGATALPADFRVRFSGPPEFGLGYDGCSTGLRQNKSCSFDLIFSPVGADRTTGEARISMGEARLTVSLAGEGVEPTTTTTTDPSTPFSVEPRNLSFGEVPVGSSATKTVTITNVSQATLSSFILLTRVQTGTATTASWAYSNECTNATLGPGESCLILVEFTPRAEGSILSDLFVALNEGISFREYFLALRAVGVSSPTASTTTTDVTTTSAVATTTVPTADSTLPPGTTTAGTGGSAPGDSTTGPPAADDAATSSGPATPVASVTITSAEIDCAGTLHVAYDTTATPQPATDANHLIVVNPDDDTATFNVVETTGNAANASHSLDHSGADPGRDHRVFVVAMFDPSNPDGPIAIDRADVQPAPDCDASE